MVHMPSMEPGLLRLSAFLKPISAWCAVYSAAKRRSGIDAINGAVSVQGAKVGKTALATQMLADTALARETFLELVNLLLQTGSCKDSVATAAAAGCYRMYV